MPGIKGQKWGIRRFQNEDGTLTPEGRERYGVGESDRKPTRQEKKERYNRGKELHKEHSEEFNRNIDRLEKKSKLIKETRSQMKDLEEEFDFDSGYGERTSRTNRNKYSEEDIERAEKRYEALSDIYDAEMDKIREKANSRATEKMLEKYGKEKMKDLEYYNKVNNRKDLAAVGLVLASFAGISLYALFRDGRASNKR